MSLLLDALQRASEEKKKLAEAAGTGADAHSQATAPEVPGGDAEPEPSSAAPGLVFPPLELADDAPLTAAPADSSPPFAPVPEPTTVLRMEPVLTTESAPMPEALPQADASEPTLAPIDPVVSQAAVIPEPPRTPPPAESSVATGVGAASTAHAVTDAVRPQQPRQPEPQPASAVPVDAPRIARELIESTQPRPKGRIDRRMGILLGVLAAAVVATAAVFVYVALDVPDAVGPLPFAQEGEAGALPDDSATVAAVEPEVSGAESAAASQPVRIAAANPGANGAVPGHAVPSSATDRPASASAARARPLIAASGAAPSRLDQAYPLLQQGRIDEAGTAYRDALRANPGEIDAMLGLAYIARLRGDNAAAVEQYQQVLRLQPGHAEANAGLLVLASEADLAAALSRVREVAERNPNSAEAQAALGGLLARQGRMAEAQQAWFKAFGIEPGNPLYAYNLAVALDRLHKYAQAASFYERAIALAAARPAQPGFLAAAQQRLAQLRQERSAEAGAQGG